MSGPPVARKPAGMRDRAKRQTERAWREQLSTLKALYGNEPRLPTNWRERLPAPGDYYATRVRGLAHDADGSARGVCPFHPDAGASLTVQLGGRGRWHCEAGCGSGDLVDFERKRTGRGFNAAVYSLVRGGS